MLGAMSSSSQIGVLLSGLRFSGSGLKGLGVLLFLLSTLLDRLRVSVRALRFRAICLWASL